MNRKRKAIPQLKSLDEEMAFWAKHSLTEFELRDVTPCELDRAAVKKPKRRALTLQLDERVVKQLKATAKQRGLGYHSLADKLLRRNCRRRGRRRPTTV